MNKPKVVLNYNKNMGLGVDKSDHYIANYCFLRKSLKWWRKLFFWGLEVCSTNSYILYKSMQKEKKEKAVSHYEFIKQLVDQLLDDLSMLETPRGRANAEQGLQRLDGKLHIILSWTKKDCIVCLNRKVPGGRRATRFYCDTCTRKSGIHVGECFAKYHTLKKYNN